jgi:hypothetical protein
LAAAHRREINRYRLATFLRAIVSEKKGLIAGEIGEIARAAQCQRLIECPLQMTVRGFDRGVLVRDSGIVASRLHSIMLAEGLAALGFTFLRREVAVSRRQSVGTMLLGHAAQLPQRFLQPLGQRREAHAAAERLDVLPAAEASQK